LAVQVELDIQKSKKSKFFFESDGNELILDNQTLRKDKNEKVPIKSGLSRIWLPEVGYYLNFFNGKSICGLEN
jgi:hypothetical protein